MSYRLSKNVVLEITTWGNWIEGIGETNDGIKVLESGLDVYILVHKGRYYEDQKSFIIIYKMLNIKRVNGDVPCIKKGINPCYNDKFSCSASKQSKTNFSRNFKTYTLLYLKDKPPLDILVIAGADIVVSCNIHRRTKCTILPSEELSCPREISGGIKKIKGKHYEINLALHASGQDLLK